MHERPRALAQSGQRRSEGVGRRIGLAAQLQRRVEASQRRTAAGEGIIPIENILNRLGNNGRCTSVTVEHWTGLQDSVEATAKLEKEWCTTSIQNLKTYFPDVASR